MLIMIWECKNNCLKLATQKQGPSRFAEKLRHVFLITALSGKPPESQ